MKLHGNCLTGRETAHCHALSRFLENRGNNKSETVHKVNAGSTCKPMYVPTAAHHIINKRPCSRIPQTQTTVQKVVDLSPSMIPSSLSPLHGTIPMCLLMMLFMDGQDAVSSASSSISISCLLAFPAIYRAFDNDWTTLKDN